MQNKHLALRLTLNSLVMILSVYLIMQTANYFRDNIILGINDLGNLIPSVGWFMISTVLPPAIVFGIITYVVALPLQRMACKLESGIKVAPEVVERTRSRMLGFSRVVLGVNLAGFALGYVLSQLASGKADQLVSPNGLLILFSNICGSIVYAQAQTSLNNLALASLRDNLGVRSIDKSKRAMRSTFKQVFLTLCLALYIITFMQFNVRDLQCSLQIEQSLLYRVQKGEINPDQAAQEYHAVFAERYREFCGRTNLDTQSVPLPWERTDTLEVREQSVFYLMGLFVFLVVLMIQIAWSLDRKDQLDALKQRLRDVVAGGGDLTQRINLRSTDEIGELTELINQVLDQFQGIVVRINESGKQTASSAQAIARVLQDSRATMAQTAQAFGALRQDLDTQTRDARKLMDILKDFQSAAQGVNKAIEIQRAHVNEASSAMEEMASSIESVESMTAQSGQLTSSLSDQGSRGTESAAQTTQAMAAILDATSDINTVLNILNKITASTNLLAMNAAIESAHAGEQGLGFAVVAEEVRKLAGNSADQTRRIRDLIKAMGSKVNHGVQTTDASIELLKSLVDGLQKAASISDEISRAMKEQALGTRSAADTLVQIVKASGTIADRMAEQNQESRLMEEALTKAIQKLEGLVTESRQQTAAVDALQESFVAVDKEVQANLETVQRLEAEISRFASA